MDSGPTRERRGKNGPLATQSARHVCFPSKIGSVQGQRARNLKQLLGQFLRETPLEGSKTRKMKHNLAIFCSALFSRVVFKGPHKTTHKAKSWNNHKGVQRRGVPLGNRSSGYLSKCLGSTGEHRKTLSTCLNARLRLTCVCKRILRYPLCGTPLSITRKKILQGPKEALSP